MIQIKNAKELDGMRRANALSAAALKYGGEHIEAGMTTWELDKLIYDFIVKHGGIPNFKGGEGHFDAKIHDDGKCKIIRGRVEPGCSSGYHLHEKNAEIIYVISGAARFNYDGVDEVVTAGNAHYCPEGHGHAMFNASETEPCEVFCVVPEHHLS